MKAPLISKFVAEDTMEADISGSSKAQEFIDTFENPMKMFFESLVAWFLMNYEFVMVKL